MRWDAVLLEYREREQEITKTTMQYFRQRLGEIAFYITLDIVVGGIAYIASYGEPGLHPGPLMMRILGAMLLANGLVGGPDTMMYWKEAGRRIKAEEDLDEAREQAAKDVAVAREQAAKDVAVAKEQAAKDVTVAREQAAKDVAVAKEQAAKDAEAARERDAAFLREIGALRAEVAELRMERQRRRPLRRPLRT